jgi:protocatechuate 3,4-dioxygenase beta subunit
MPCTTLVADEDDRTWDAGLYLPARLGDYVWHDVNANGIQEAGEPGISSVSVNLLDSGNNVIGSTSTDANGLYLFSNLIPGTYSVQFVAPAGYSPSPKDQGGDDALDSDADLVTGQTHQTALLSGGEDLTLDAGYFLKARLGDYVWHDTNANGIQEVDEPGIPNVTVNLLNSGGTQIGSTTTDANGLYIFDNLVPGTYSVEFVAPAGFLPSPSDQGGDDALDSDADVGTGRTHQTTLLSGGQDLTLDAGYYKLAALGDFVWYDTNSNGIQDAGEAGIPNVTVNLLNSGGTVIGTTTTDANGLYLFANLTPGTYAVEFVAPAGHTTSPQDQGGDDALDSDADTTTGRTTNVNLASGDVNLTLDAGYFEPEICVPANLAFHGSSQTYGTKGNIREYSIDGINVRVSAFSRTTDSGGWYPAFLGIYSGGLGVTDSSEGDGSNSMHTVDNVGRGNYVLFEFSEPVVVNSATLGYVVGDSDLTVWVGNAADPYNNHLSLSDALLAGFGGPEHNDTASGSPRTASFNAGNLTGNVLVIAASTSDTTPDDRFKIQALGLCVPPPPPVASLGNFVWEDKNVNGIQDANEPGVNGVLVQLYRCADTLVANTSTSGGGYYAFNDLAPGDYYVKFTLPSGYVFSPPNQGNDSTDSDAEGTTGKTVCITLAGGENNDTLDAGINKPEEPEECVPATAYFNGSSATYGTAGNIRTYSVDGVNIRASAFSRSSSGYWSSAYLGVYSGGLGVTDSSEGTGGSNKHVVDNIDRNNYILFEFSEPVIVDSAYLGYVVNDSDLTVWVGTADNPYNNHLTLTDSLLASFGTAQSSDTTSSSPRWASFNGSRVVGNVLVIAASISDSTPDDGFKIQKLGICAPSVDPCPAPYGTSDIGAVAKTGSLSYNPDYRKFTLKGSGADIWGTSDEFRYGYMEAQGDCVIVARVLSVENTDPWAKAGVMIRESLNANSKHASTFLTPGNGAAFQCRASTGGSSDNINTGTHSAPYWVAVVREGNTFSSYRSSNGANWTLIGSKYISMGSSVYIGLAVTSHNDGELCTATFDNVYGAP